MTHPRIATGVTVLPRPPLRSVGMLVWLMRLFRLDSLMLWDHLQDFTPRALWDERITWLAREHASPHAYFDYQVLLGHLATRVGGMQLGVGVTEPIRRHPVLIAQAMTTLAHLTRRPPILGIGAGERENTEPYGLDFARPVARLEEALRVIRLCLASRGPFDFRGEFYRLDGALMELEPPPGRAPPIWVAAHGPRMLRLTGRHGDGWYPTGITAPDEYAAKLALIHQAAREAGRDPGAIVPAMHATIVVAPSGAKVRELLATPLVRYTALLSSTGETWRKRGLVHPFGERYGGYADFLPERYDRPTLDRAIAAVPDDMPRELLLCGTPDEIVDRLRALGEAGLRHVVLLAASAAVSRRSLFDSLRGIRRIAARLRSGR